MHRDATGTAGRYDDGLESFTTELAAAAAKTASRDAHQAVWSEFWEHSDITVKAASSPADPPTAAQADRVTFLDKVNRAAFHSMALGEAYCPLPSLCAQCVWQQHGALTHAETGVYVACSRALQASMPSSSTRMGFSQPTLLPKKTIGSGGRASGFKISGLMPPRSLCRPQ